MGKPQTCIEDNNANEKDYRKRKREVMMRGCGVRVFIGLQILESKDVDIIRRSINTKTTNLLLLTLIFNSLISLFLK